MNKKKVFLRDFGLTITLTIGILVLSAFQNNNDLMYGESYSNQTIILESKMVIESKIIGTLEQHEEFSDWWISNEIPIPFFDNKGLEINFTDFVLRNDANFIAEADQALENFLKLTIKDRNAISELAYKNCMDFLDLVEFSEADEPLRQIKNKNEIWNFIEPTAIYVERRGRRDKDIYIQIACNCAWEEEHGLQLVFRQGKKLTRISEQDGWLTEADAFDIPDEEDELLSKFNKQ